ncbi:MAG: NAD(+) diphosphatase [Lachnospiraceae bacterium]|nr:NAD(+) diphosphatase [Lachnospiraceae bacterium]
MIHEIAPHFLDNQYHGGRTPAGDSPIILFFPPQLLVKDTEELTFLTYDEIKEHLAGPCRYLFNIDGTNYFLGTPAEGCVTGEKDDRICTIAGARLMNWVDLRRANPRYEAFAGMTAMHLNTWYSSVRYCGRCGTKASHDDTLRMMKCPKCGLMMFPKINPAVVVAVTDGERLLLTRYARRNGNFALIAGFIEIGETAEECCAREVMEEVGIHIKNIRYVGSQPWGFDGNLMLAYTAELDDSHKITLDEDELSEARWMLPEEVPVVTEDSSLTRDIINRFRNGELFS